MSGGGRGAGAGSPPGRMSVAEVAAWLAAEPARTGLCLDFDGTLAPILEDPEEVRLRDGLGDLLADLATRLAALAIVSGRPAAFLGERAAVPGARLFGLYGLEEHSGGAVRARPEAERWRAQVGAVRERLRQAFDGATGILVEDKGLSVAVHWRRAPDRDAAGRRVSALVEALARDSGLAREPGKLVEELRPPVDWDKGAAVRALAAEASLRRLAYVGDDLGDLAAFAAVRALGGLAVAVDHGAETPAALRAAADAVVAGHDGVVALLEGLRARL